MMRYFPTIAFEDKEFELISKAKERHGGNYHDFLLDVVREYLEKLKGGNK